MLARRLMDRKTEMIWKGGFDRSRKCLFGKRDRSVKVIFTYAMRCVLINEISNNADFVG